MPWSTSRSTHLRLRTSHPDDLFIAANSFEPRCLYALATARDSGYRAKLGLLVEYESSSLAQQKIKRRHRTLMLTHAKACCETVILMSEAKKYDVVRYVEQLRGFLASIRPPGSIAIDITTFTKCTLASTLTVLHRLFPGASIRCFWTPGLYGKDLELTTGVKQSFVVPGFGGFGWDECKTLVVLLGQEADRTYSLWRAVDPDRTFLIASESEYSSVSGRRILGGMRYLQALGEVKSYTIDGVDPNSTLQTLRKVREIIREDGDEERHVAFSCFGTKLGLLGAWSFFEELNLARRFWHYVYVSPLRIDKYTTDFYRELVEAELTREGSGSG